MNGFTEIMEYPEYKESQIKVACVGDSVTYGHGIKNQPKNNYPSQLANLLGDEYNVRNFGISGSTTSKEGDQPYYITEAYSESLEYKADILVFMLGSNDSKPENWRGYDVFENWYISLLDTYLKDNNPTVYLCTPPTAFHDTGRDDGLTNYDINPEIVEEIADVIRKVAKERGYALIDINDLTENRSELFNKDHVHPNNDGATAIAKAVYEAIK